MNNIQNIHGFNYQPSYAYNGADIWRRFDAGVYGRELALGKQRFPKMNGVRLWLAAEVFMVGSDGQREQFLRNVDTCQPYSGNPTVRDERGACGNVTPRTELFLHFSAPR